MYAVRQFSVRNARFFEVLYDMFAESLTRLHPLWKTIGYQRMEKPMVAVERQVKGFLFDCQMCGQCALSATGMSCPTNCPKSLRNGPCGGVRSDGNCEVMPDMRCVWVDAFEGSRQMHGGDAIEAVLPPVDHRLYETSSWLRVTQEAAAHRAAGRAVVPAAAE